LRFRRHEAAGFRIDRFAALEEKNFGGEFVDGFDHSLTELGMDDALAEM
jgi:hypothetical protein